jgi:hypothetical protein
MRQVPCAPRVMLAIGSTPHRPSSNSAPNDGSVVPTTRPCQSANRVPNNALGSTDGRCARQLNRRSARSAAFAGAKVTAAQNDADRAAAGAQQPLHSRRSAQDSAPSRRSARAGACLARRDAVPFGLSPRWRNARAAQRCSIGPLVIDRTRGRLARGRGRAALHSTGRCRQCWPTRERRRRAFGSGQRGRPCDGGWRGG